MNVAWLPGVHLFVRTRRPSPIRAAGAAPRWGSWPRANAAVRSNGGGVQTSLAYAEAVVDRCNATSQLAMHVPCFNPESSASP